MSNIMLARLTLVLLLRSYPLYPNKPRITLAPRLELA